MNDPFSITRSFFKQKYLFRIVVSFKIENNKWNLWKCNDKDDDLGQLPWRHIHFSIVIQYSKFSLKINYIATFEIDQFFLLFFAIIRQFMFC